MSDEASAQETREEKTPPIDGQGNDETGARGTAWTPDALRRLRADRERRQVALLAAALVGLAAAWLHWFGLFVAGALVGLASRDLRRAVAAGLGMGAFVLVVGVLASPAIGPGEFLALTPPAYVAVAAAVVLPVWGSLLRGVV